MYNVRLSHEYNLFYKEHNAILILFLYKNLTLLLFFDNIKLFLY